MPAQARWRCSARARRIRRWRRSTLPLTLTLTRTLVHWHARAGTVAVLSAGTADEAVAEECRLTADVMGCYCFRIPDLSVDGLHRILHNLPAVRAADVVVVVVGTDGALPAVVAGLVEAPVVVVPTSIGYGAALQVQPKPNITPEPETLKKLPCNITLRGLHKALEVPLGAEAGMLRAVCRSSCLRLWLSCQNRSTRRPTLSCRRG